MKNVLKVVMVIIGGMIGAGFASGKEMYIFFMQYGSMGILGLIISTILTGGIIYKVFSIISRQNINSYSEFLEYISKGRMSKIINKIVNVFLLISFYIMIAGFGAYLNQTLHLHVFIGSSILCILCYFVFRKDISGIIKISTWMVPILIILIIIIGIKSYEPVKIITYNNSLNWIISSILYTSYNSILLIPILIPMKYYIKQKKQNIGITVFAIIFLFVLSSSILAILLKSDIDINKIEMPVAYVASMIGKKYVYIYGIVILLSIFTSAITSGYGFLQNITKSKRNYPRIVLFMCITAVIISSFGFSGLVTTLYPVFGVLGFVQIVLLMCK